MKIYKGLRTGSQGGSAQTVGEKIDLLRTTPPRHILKKSSALYRLDPILDENGILRVGGRFQQADVPCEVKHPIILPKKSV